MRWGDRFTTVDYPPVALYELAAAGAAYRLFDPSFHNSRLLNVAMKLPPLLAEIGLVALLWRVIRRQYGDAPASWACAAFWANPSMILAGPILGYLDPLMALPAVGSIVAVACGSSFAAGALLAIACLTKAQAVFILPVVVLASWRIGRARGVAVTASGTAIVSALVVVPFVAAGAWRNMLQGVGSLLRHDMLSADAANAWWIVTYLMRAVYAVHDLGVWGAWTMTVRILGISRVVELGYPNPRPLAAAAVVAASLWALWRVRHERGLTVVVACTAFIVHAYFVLGVQVHENHLYLAVPLLGVAASVERQLRPVFFGVSAVFALNLFLFFGLGRDFPLPPRNLTIVDTTVLIAAVNCALFVVHARRLARRSAKRGGGRISVLRPCENTSLCDPASPAGLD